MKKAIISLISLLLLAGCATTPTPKTLYKTGDCVEQITTLQFKEPVATLENGDVFYRIEVIRNVTIKVECPVTERPMREHHGRMDQ